MTLVMKEMTIVGKHITIYKFSKKQISCIAHESKRLN